MKVKPAIEICIPAYNEEQNIKNILNDILRQKTLCYHLKKITVYIDGSTDHTVQIIKSDFKGNKLIRLKIGNTRKGKVARLNQIFKDFTSDILVILDADIGLVGKKFLDNLIKPIIKNKQLQLVSAKETPIRPNNFFGKIIYQSFVNWDYVCSSVPNSDTVHSFGGAATAYRSSLVKKLRIPNEVREERMYLYLFSKNEGGYMFNEKASILYWPVSTFNDFLGLMQRSFGEKDKILDKIFGFDTDSILRIPLKYKLIGICKAFLHDPIYTPLALILNVTIAKFKNRKKVDKSSIWKFSESTKKPIDSNLYA